MREFVPFRHIKDCSKEGQDKPQEYSEKLCERGRTTSEELDAGLVACYYTTLVLFSEIMCYI